MRKEHRGARAVFTEAVAAYRTGNLARAQSLLTGLCEGLSPRPEALHLLGLVTHRLGRPGGAELIARAVALDPAMAEANNDLGVIRVGHGEFEKAFAAFEAALAVLPRFAEALNNAGGALARLGRIEEACRRHEAAIACAPRDPAGHVHLAALRLLQGDPAAAVQHYGEAARIAPSLGLAHLGLGHATRALGRPDEALGHYLAAERIGPPRAGTMIAHGQCLRQAGRLVEAREAFARALKVEPDNPEALIALVMSVLPILAANTTEVAQARTTYAAALANLGQAVATAQATPGALKLWARTIGAVQPFYLPYLGENDRDLQALWGGIVARVMSGAYPGAVKLPAPPPAGAPIRIGIVSGFFRQHSNWRIPIRGWMAGLNRARFQLFAYHTDSRTDAATAEACSLAHRLVQGPLPLEGWMAEIARDGPHVLIYPEIGMDIVAAQLAGLRLAPVQCASWGHPQTTGYPTIDYYLSASAMEPPEADSHYTERLVRLPGLSAILEPSPQALLGLSRAGLGLGEDRVVYWCGQSPPKHLPRHDGVFARIAKAVPASQFVFIAFPGPRRITDVFERRLAAAFNAEGLDWAHHCVVIDRLDPEGFRAAMGLADVFLDSIGWSGCNSTIEALGHDLPIVTVRGPMMRANHTSAMLEVMGLGQNVSADVEAYIAHAVKLGLDAPARLEARAGIASHKSRLFADRSCIPALEAFLVTAVQGK